MLVASPVARPCHLPIHAVDSGLATALMVDIGASTDGFGGGGGVMTPPMTCVCIWLWLGLCV